MRLSPVLAALALLWPASSFAQPGSDQEAMAAAQFDRGLAAMNEGNFAVGCPALSESVRIDPRPGAIFTLAECEARWGRIASADTHYGDYLARFARMTVEQQRQQRGREVIATQKRADLRSQIPYLAIQLPAGAPGGTIVKRDGITLGAASLGVSLPIDPGPHTVEVELADGAKSRRTVTLALADKQSLVVELPAPLAVPLPPGDAPAAVATDSAPRARPWAGYVLVGVGVVGVGIGIGAGVVALSERATLREHCAGTTCDHDGKLAADAAQSAALVSTVGFAVGAVALASGVVFMLTRKDPPPAARGGAVRLTGLRFDATALTALGDF